MVLISFGRNVLSELCQEIEWREDLPKKRLSRSKKLIITTEWRYHSHAWHMGTRFLVAYPNNGQWHKPPLDVVAAYVDQKPENDLSESRSSEFGFPIYASIAETLRCGGDKLAVNAVLIIGEHGDYLKNEFAQTLYPRYVFFKEVVDVFKQDGRTVPIFNDKHLSWRSDSAVDPILLASESERDLFGRADVQGRRNVYDRRSPLSYRTDIAHCRSGRGRCSIARQK